MQKGINVTQALSRYASGLHYEDIPANVREISKRSILDSIGITIAASTQGMGHRELVGLILDAGGRPDSTIFGYANKVPSWMAALANGSMARALDYDETLDDSLHHPSDVTVPAALAVAQRLRASGRQLIAAVTLGNDIICRMLHSIARRLEQVKFDWFFTSLFGIFGASAACGRLFGLDANQMEDALGISLYQAAGTFQARFTPGYSMIWNMASGFPAMAAVMSASMAHEGITGAKSGLEGKAGLYSMYLGGDYDGDIIVRGLGKRFENANISFKPWPGIRYNHSYIDATLQIMREYKISAQNIKKITLFVAGWVQSFCEPIEERRRPSTVLEAKRSLPYLVAVAATKGKVLVRDVTPVGIEDNDVLQFAQKITCEHDDRFSAESKIGPALVEIQLMDDRSYSRQLEFAYGHPINPMTWQDLADKFRDCTSYSAKPLSHERIETAIDMVSHLEEIDDVNSVVELLA